jgi:exodeoxyribonuclease III
VRIATFNAAGIRARLPYLLRWLQDNPVDILAVQETKVEDHIFPAAAFEELGYQAILNGQKAWNGVCFLTRLSATNVSKGFGDAEMPEDARIIAADFNGIRVINTYVPNGNTVGSEKWEYKMSWLERFRAYLDEIPTGQQVLWLGDINIAPQPHDVYDSKKVLGGVGHHPDEFSRLSNIVGYGLIDLFRVFEFGGGHYSYWEFTIPGAVQKGVGWRIDHIYATEQLAEKCLSCVIDKDARLGEKPSDHTFVIAEFDV